MTPAQTSKLVAVMIASYPSQDIEQATSELYERMLADLDVNAATAAVQALIATSRFFPTIAEIRAACFSVEHGEIRPGGSAWGDVLRAVSEFGFYRSPTFADPIVARAVDALGWRELCSSENQVADRARFVELYDQLAVQSRRHELTKALPAVVNYQRKLEERTGPMAIGDSLEKVLNLSLQTDVPPDAIEGP